MNDDNENENAENNLSPIQKELRDIREKYPQIWNEILKSNICPCNFGLHNSCGMEAESCKKCWETALKIVLDENITITDAGYYLCKECNKPLVFDKVSRDSEQFWHCPKCLKYYKIKLNGDIATIEKTDKTTSDNAQTKPNETNVDDFPASTGLSYDMDDDEGNEPDNPF